MDPEDRKIVTSPDSVGEMIDDGASDLDRDAMADHEADRAADAFWGHGL